MRFSRISRARSRGVTLIELSAAMLIITVATVGLGTGIVNIVGFYQDDWVTKDVRYWGYECMDYIVENIERSKRIKVNHNIARYDGLIITPQDTRHTIKNIQATEHDGLMVNGMPMLKYADFPADGIYREEGQRIVALETFQVKGIMEYPEYRKRFQGRARLKGLTDTLYIIEMLISVTTKFQGEESTEYIKFKRTIWAQDKYFNSGSSG